MTRLFVMTALLAAVLTGCGGDDAKKKDDKKADDKDKKAAAAAPELNLAHFSAEDQAAAKKQGFCPVGGPDHLLGADDGMVPVKVDVDGRTVFLCCDGCEEALRADPEKYFAVLDGEGGHDHGDAEHGHGDHSHGDGGHSHGDAKGEHADEPAPAGDAAAPADDAAAPADDADKS